MQNISFTKQQEKSNPHQIDNIVIVGGGTAGWLSANYLNKALNGSQPGSCQITLIESSDIGTLGVGEATIPTLLETFNFLGISEAEWMTKCNATFKLAIKFVNWSGLQGQEVFWHPFGQWYFTKGTRVPISHYWLKRKLQGNHEPFDYSCFEAVELCEAKKAPKFNHDSEYTWRVEYAYHLDAGLLATYLKEKAKTEGVRHIVDNVLDVSLDEKGFINHLITEKHGNLAGELFIDCSGFRGLLINQALGEPFVSFADCLWCDRAIAIPVSYDPQDPYNENHGGINPYTTATALSSGWTWNIPLVSRSGTGYVYSSAFTSQADAEMEFLKHLGEKSQSLQSRYIKMRIGRTRNTWVKNCVSIGLASGFIEPLESTGIYLIEAGLKHLIHHFPNRLFHPSVIDNYNCIMRDQYEEIRDFIVMHYCLSKREDTPFWRANKYEPVIPDSLKAKIELWQAMLPNNPTKISWLFPDYSYICILAGLGAVPQATLPLLDYQDDRAAEQAFENIRNQATQLKRNLPSHVDYLKMLAGTNSVAATESLLVRA
ncbi:tryptophan halogenase family protein [Iningainema tapete]|uniref:Tryptophan 7-halogenase n=1 Tax=Iningainema tapete BLCC-T55 TaxID=2748662 RepID=A0A8J7BXQ4_9CYAN|nr:tryptophan halogenase family protein [Iningainema tapete]MBD2774167.1 tryptophan 7-halogenase [Iningainema tapete BLCC-T55]